MTRAELYELIWNEPMTRVAARLGVSNVALRRICDRNDIPRPRPGHWSKLAYGKSIVRTPLSESSLSSLDSVSFPTPASQVVRGWMSGVTAALYLCCAALEC